VLLEKVCECVVNAVSLATYVRAQCQTRDWYVHCGAWVISHPAGVVACMRAVTCCRRIYQILVESKVTQWATPLVAAIAPVTPHATALTTSAQTIAAQSFKP
jgi:hypothetical protein